MENKELMIPCNCGCSILKFETFDDELFISHYESTFYSHQRPIRTAISDYFKRLWKAIVGKDFWFFDIVLNPDEVKKFNQDLVQFLKE